MKNVLLKLSLTTLAIVVLGVTSQLTAQNYTVKINFQNRALYDKCIINSIVDSPFMGGKTYYSDNTCIPKGREYNLVGGGTLILAGTCTASVTLPAGTYYFKYVDELLGGLGDKFEVKGNCSIVYMTDEKGSPIITYPTW